MARPRPIIIPGPTGFGGKSTNIEASIDPIAAVNLFRRLTGKPTLQEEQENKKALSEYDVLSQFLGIESQPPQAQAVDQNPFINAPQALPDEGLTDQQKIASIPFLRDLVKSNIESQGKMSLEKLKADIARGTRQEEAGLDISAKTTEFLREKELEQLKQKGKANVAKIKSGTPKDAKGFLLPNGDVASSFDGGRTYIDISGKTLPMPPGSVPIPPGSAINQLRTQKARRDAAGRILGTDETSQSISPEEAAKGGTGPYANLKAAFDRLAGGLGVDAVFGKQGFYPDTQDNRQKLRTLKQIGKTALINSPRFPVAEQKIVDKLFPDPDVFWTNPATEARKFDVLRKVMLETKAFNDRAIVNASAKEIDKLLESNQEIDRFLSIIGTGGQAGGVQEGSTATNLQTGEKIIFKGGQWQSME